MIIQRITLQNYRRFARLQLEFPQNLIGIMGKNGTGKSTLVEAIGWALYGNRMARSDKGEIRSQFADQSEPCVVELDFSYGGQEYRIVRRLKGKNATLEAAIYRPGSQEPEAVTDRGVNDYVEHLLKLDYRSFVASVFARQRELASLSSMSPEDRRKSIHRLIDLDLIDQARGTVRTDAREKEQFLDGLRQGLLDLDDLRAHLGAVVEKEAPLQSLLEQRQRHVGERESLLKAAREEHHRQEKMRDLHQQSESRLQTNASSILSSEQSLERIERDLKDIVDAESAWQRLRPDLEEFAIVKIAKERLDVEREHWHKRSALLEKERQFGNSLEGLENQIQDLAARLTEKTALEEMKDASSKELEENVLSQQQAQGRLAQAKGRLEAVKKAGETSKARLEEIKELGPEGQCPTCTQKLSDHYPEVIGQLEEELARLRAEYLEAAAWEKQVAEEIGQLTMVIDAKREEEKGLIARLSGLKETARILVKAESDRQAILLQIEPVRNQLDLLGPLEYDEDHHRDVEARYQSLLPRQQEAARMQERASRRSAAEADRAQYTQTLADLRRSQKEEVIHQQTIGYREADWLACKQKVDECDGAFLRATKQLADAQQQLAVLQQERLGLERQVGEQEAKRAEIEQRRIELVSLQALAEHFNLFRQSLTARIRPLIAARASELLALTTSGRYPLMDLDEDYQINLYDGSNSFALNRFSGGEQDVANLCLRVAISQIVAERSGAGVSFIILDEIFGSQDDERKHLVLQALGQLTSQFRQIFIITHVETIRDLLPVMVEVTFKDEATSEARLV
jgi:DNA repair protein SbcC/Rad50